MIAFVHEIVARGLRSRLVKATAIVLVANMMSGAMNFLTVIMMIRYLTPEAFGILAFALTTIQLTSMLINVGLSETQMTMVSRADAADRPKEVIQSITTTILRIRLIVIANVVLGAFLLAEPIAAGVFGQPHLASSLFLGVLGGCGVTLCQFNLTGLLALRQYKRHATIFLSRYSFILLAIAFLVAVGKLDLTAAIIINISAPFLAFTVSLCFVSVPLFRGGGKPFELLYRIWEQSKWVAVANICNMFLGRLEIYLLAAFASRADLGIYSAASKLCGGIFLVETAMKIVLFPEISRRSGSPTLKPFVLRCIGGLVLLVGVVYALGLLASPLIPVLLGESYRGSVPIFLIILAAHAFLIPLIPVRLLLFATDRTRIGAMLGVLQLAVLVGSGLILIPTYGASGAAWTQVVVSLAAVVLWSIFAWPHKSKLGAAFTLRQPANR